ncbi:hydrogenase [Achromobacter xylosoxidans]|uniref:Hydrogenase n=1 Tax=Alcaligenes xylosoxydans xylosoxydans TaxID=85698 RepID=A0A424WAE5_ALCXX|nr:hydrogenase [Achromobacter xylosoxidans]MBC9905069.1 hydrogenase [Achromobacter xylosoxidans]MBD0870621.1 hydrogenase [Achromobacter xylosoxidans]QNP85685.1 hydrogenase [Achromobacter xylosoxidans]RPJ90309.1 hydrogenase [Achromobacter xylosoxidans]
MPLRPLTVLTYTPGKPGAASRLVDVGDALVVPAAPTPHGVYQTRQLIPSARLLGWARSGARFELSRTGAARVWSEGRMQASECPRDRASAGAAELNQEDIAYLEAYLLSQGRRWSDAHATHSGHP